MTTEERVSQFQAQLLCGNPVYLWRYGPEGGCWRQTARSRTFSTRRFAPLAAMTGLGGIWERIPLP